MNAYHARNSKLLYRDMIRVVRTVMDDRKKIPVLTMIRKEFEKNRSINDDNEILKLKNNASKALADIYVLYVKSTIKEDPKNPNKDYLI